MKCFNGFCKGKSFVQAETVNDILEMMGLRVQKEALDAIIAEVDEDGKHLPKLALSHFNFQTIKHGKHSKLHSSHTIHPSRLSQV